MADSRKILNAAAMTTQLSLDVGNDNTINPFSSLTKPYKARNISLNSFSSSFFSPNQPKQGGVSDFPSPITRTLINQPLRFSDPKSFLTFRSWLVPPLLNRTRLNSSTKKPQHQERPQYDRDPYNCRISYIYLNGSSTFGISATSTTGVAARSDPAV